MTIDAARIRAMEDPRTVAPTFAHWWAMRPNAPVDPDQL